MTAQELKLQHNPGGGEEPPKDDGIEERVSRLENVMDNLVPTLEDLRGYAKKISEDAAGTNEGLRGLTGEVQSLRGEFAGINRGFEALGTEVKALHRGFEDVGSSVKALSTEMHEVSTGIGGIRDDLREVKVQLKGVPTQWTVLGALIGIAILALALSKLL